jgi:hypothetical protein
MKNLHISVSTAVHIKSNKLINRVMNIKGSDENYINI